MIPEFLPGVGAGIGIDNTTRAVNDGRYVDDAKEAGLTLLGEALPILGDIAFTAEDTCPNDNLWGVLTATGKKHGGKSVENMQEVAHSSLNGPQLKPNAIKKIEDNPYGATMCSEAYG